MDNGLGRKYLVAQLGSRRHYAVPVVLHEHGMLASFHTDYYHGISTFQHLPGVPVSLQSRHSPKLPASLVSHHFPLFVYARLSGVRNRTYDDRIRQWVKVGSSFCRRIVERGLGQADSVYAFTSAALELFIEARSSGRLCILDHATAPLHEEELLVERAWKAHPQYFPGRTISAEVRNYQARQQEEWRHADRIVCNSAFLQRMIESAGGPAQRCAVVPLGYAPPEPNEASELGRHDSKTLRVLFVGDDGLRKGLGVAVDAIEQLGFGADSFRVAGSPELTEAGKKWLTQRATHLGRLSRSGMAEQYAWADVVVLPSFSDTFGLVVLEAMSRGVPVVLTPNTGAADVVRHRENGIVVPVGDVEALAKAFDELHSDRNFLAHLSQNASAASRSWDLNSYGERLVNALQGAAAPLS